jgi:hypothetical protein
VQATAWHSQRKATSRKQQQQSRAVQRKARPVLPQRSSRKQQGSSSMTLMRTRTLMTRWCLLMAGELAGAPAADMLQADHGVAMWQERACV